MHTSGNRLPFERTALGICLSLALSGCLEGSPSVSVQESKASETSETSETQSPSVQGTVPDKPATVSAPAPSVTLPPEASVPNVPVSVTGPVDVPVESPVTGAKEPEEPVVAVTPATPDPVTPPAIELPVVEPPAVETPAVETPAVKPPVVEPPVVEPPVVEPPAEEPPRFLELTVEGGTGSGTIELDDTETLHEIVAFVPTGQVFAGWEGDTDALVDPAAATTSVRLPDEDATYRLEATFSVDPRLNLLADDPTTSRFLTFASMGPSGADLDRWRGEDAAAWLEAELQKPALELTGKVMDERGENGHAPFRSYMSHQFDRSLYESQAELRTRMTFALSQILVIGGDDVVSPFLVGRGAAFHDTLQKHAFGNYRDLLHDVTLSSAMGAWLTYIGNPKADPAKGSEPDENYARELLQLFTIGLYELERDGTVKLDASGQPIETYRNEDIAQLARVFTGLNYASASSIFVNFGQAKASGHLPMKFIPGEHSEREKAFMGTVIPAGTPGEQSLDMALDAIFAHPNVGPFVSRQLIQRFTASDPIPAYVERVSTAFDEGRFVSADGTEFGDGRRGSLEATIAAILLDATLFIEPDPFADAIGKVREPLLSVAHWMHAFGAKNFEMLAIDTLLADTAQVGSLQMAYFRSPSVFNFYRPGYVPPNTIAGDRGMTVPEFQLADTTAFPGYINVMSALALESPTFNRCPAPTTSGSFRGANPCNDAGGEQPYAPDYSAEIALANDATALVDHLDVLLVGGRLEPDVRDEIIEAVDSIDLAAGDETEQRTLRTRLAVLMVTTSPSFQVIY